jgi:hydroxyethylthiazole kinase
MSDSPGAALRDLRERKPLIHQITNYVVMNETANATLAIGALPVMAHAPEEVEEMASAAGALVLNIGTLSRHWIDAMLLAGSAAMNANIPIVLDPVGVGATKFRTETAWELLQRIHGVIVRGNAAEVAALGGIKANIRGVEAIDAEGSGELIARVAAKTLGVVASVTGPVDHVADWAGNEAAVANGDPLLATITGSGCMATTMTACFAAVRPEAPVDAAAYALAAYGVAAEDAARKADGPGTFHARLYDALYALTPESLDERANIQRT